MPRSNAATSERVPQIISIVLRQATKQFQQDQITAAQLKAVVKRIRRELDEIGWELLEPPASDKGLSYRARCRQGGQEMELTDFKSDEFVTE